MSSCVHRAGFAPAYPTNRRSLQAGAAGVCVATPNTVVEPRVDGLFEMHINPYAPAGEKGGDGMRFLALQENKMLTFTWNAPPSLPEVRKQRTFVVVRFIEKSPAETEVRLHHTGWGEGGEWDKAFDYLSRAWPAVLGNLNVAPNPAPLIGRPGWSGCGRRRNRL